MKYHIFDDGQIKRLRSPEYNYVFDKKTGHFSRWGKTLESDPVMAPGPEILDLEISEGPCIACDFCYKENGQGQTEHHMNIEEFKTILSKMPPTLTQIAFGITNIGSNPDFFAMMDHSRAMGIIPNYTCNGHGVTTEVAEYTAKTCGAVAVSVYDKDKSYNAIHKFTEAGMTQINIHFMLCEETYDKAFEILEDRLIDPRLSKLNAIVFLAYKPKGHNKGQFHTIRDIEKYKKIIAFCAANNISFGCDSCSAPMILKAYHDSPLYDKVAPVIEPCEAGCFSSYINCHGFYSPCSFTEGEGDWEQGLNVLTCNDFSKDIWFQAKTELFRQELLSSTQKDPVCMSCKSQSICRVCPTFEGIRC
jgi:hypothetical protein